MHFFQQITFHCYGHNLTSLTWIARLNAGYNLTIWPINRVDLILMPQMISLINFNLSFIYHLLAHTVYQKLAFFCFILRRHYHDYLNNCFKVLSMVLFSCVNCKRLHSHKTWKIFKIIIWLWLQLIIWYLSRLYVLYLLLYIISFKTKKFSMKIIDTHAWRKQ